MARRVERRRADAVLGELAANGLKLTLAPPRLKTASPSGWLPSRDVKTPVLGPATLGCFFSPVQSAFSQHKACKRVSFSELVSLTTRMLKNRMVLAHAGAAQRRARRQPLAIQVPGVRWACSRLAAR